MIWRLAELNRVLIAVRDLLDDESRVAPLDAVLRQCATAVIEGRLPNHEETIECAMTVGFLVSRGETLRLTSEGEMFLGLNPESLFDLATDQKRLLLRTAFLNGAFRAQTKTLLEAFAPSPGNETFRWSAFDSPSLGDGPTVDNLLELGLLSMRGESSADGLEVDLEYVDPVVSFLAEGEGFTEKDLERHLQERREVGALAERLAFAFECDRLRDLRYDVEAACVRPVSSLKTAAGYDIESFDGGSGNVHYDRFIEVKGSRGVDVQFIWSENEMRIARRLASQYWIYFLGGLDTVAGAARNRPLMFQNPIETLLSNAVFTVTQHGVLVAGRIRGDRLTSPLTVSVR